RLRMEAIDARFLTLRGSANHRALTPGFKFDLDQYPVKEMNGKAYLLVKVHHEARQHFVSGETEGDRYFNVFECTPGTIAYRPERKTPKPVITGTQTAIVTGPKAEEIHTDEYGRVKVKFHWDRRTDQKGDGDMSCWIRVSQGWAGSGYGAVHVPRVGHEVIVSFLDGNPDRPVITGGLYHGHNRPPYTLPAEKTKSTLKTRSTKNGDDNHNEIRFEDLKDSEEFYTHAAKDRNEVVENDRSIEVKNDQTTQVKNNRAIIVSEGDERHQVQKGGREVSVKSDEKHLNSADFFHKVSGGYTLSVDGDITIDASGTVRINGAKVIINN
ncbi:MAG: type VI secretion system tip protein VgrG, partial [Desulfatitalea sp.]|nr:type VI secretion system tip protein VgrG [Desulfatitalea sp.]